MKTLHPLGLLCISGIQGEGYSPIKVTGVLVVPFRGLILWIGTAWGAKT